MHVRFHHIKYYAFWAGYFCIKVLETTPLWSSLITTEVVSEFNSSMDRGYHEASLLNELVWTLPTVWTLPKVNLLLDFLSKITVDMSFEKKPRVFAFCLPLSSALSLAKQVVQRSGYRYSQKSARYSISCRKLRMFFSKVRLSTGSWVARFFEMPCPPWIFKRAFFNIAVQFPVENHWGHDL